MDQSSSSEANCRSASHEIPCFLWNPRVHYSVHKNPTLVSILNQLNSIHTFHPISLRYILILWHEAWQNSGARETAIARQRPCKQAAIPEPSLGNESASNNGGTIGGGVFYVVCAVYPINLLVFQVVSSLQIFLL
jgi:alanine dehydrogenase